MAPCLCPLPCRPQGPTTKHMKENLALPVALNCNSAVFAGHDEGAAGWARIATLIETAKLNGIEPHAWLKATLEPIAAGHSDSDIDELLLWNFRPPRTPQEGMGD